jgi:hypothetical protein
MTRVAGGGAGWLVICAGLAAMLPATAQAQDTLLDEITVTAQKREESALEVPVTVFRHQRHFHPVRHAV